MLSLTNLWRSSVVSAPVPALSGKVITTSPGDAALLTAPTMLASWPPDVAPTRANVELLRVIDIAGDALTVVRAQEGSTLRVISAGDQLAQIVTAGTFTEIVNTLNALSMLTISASPLDIGAWGWVQGLTVSANGCWGCWNDTQGNHTLGVDGWVNCSTASGMPGLPADTNPEGTSGVSISWTHPNIQIKLQYGSIWLSEDYGVTYTQVKTGLPTYPNADAKMIGPRCAIDPLNPLHMLVATVRNGLWRTTNGGWSWAQVTSVPVGIPAQWLLNQSAKGDFTGEMWSDSTYWYAGYGVSTVLFDHSSDPINGHTSRIVVGVMGQGVYVSNDGGATFVAEPVSTVASPIVGALPYTVTPQSMSFGPRGDLYMITPRPTWGMTVTATAGTFKIVINGVATANIAWNADAATIQAAVEAIPGVVGMVATWVAGAQFVFFFRVAGGIEFNVDTTDLTGSVAFSDFTHLNLNGPKGTWRRDPSGVWTNISIEEWQSGTICIAADPHNPGRVLQMQSGWTDQVRLARITADNGVSWQICTPTFGPANGDLEGLRNIAAALTWLSLGMILFDPVIPNRFILAEGTGVWQGDLPDAGASSSIVFTPKSKRIEQMVGTAVVAMPDGSVLAGGWDRKIFRQIKRKVFPTTYFPNTAFGSCWYISKCRTNPAFVAYSLANHQDGGAVAESGWYNGGSWTPFATIPLGATSADTFGYGQIEARTPDNLVWVSAYSHGVQYTTNRGATWNAITLEAGAPAGEANGMPNYINRRPLACDDDYFYLFVSGNGVYRAADGSGTWEKRCGMSVIGTTDYYWHTQLMATPGKQGDLWMINGITGDPPSYSLQNKTFHSTDGAANWTEVDDIQSVDALGWGLPIGGSSEQTMLAVGWMNAGTERSIAVSTDAGKTWKRVGDWPGDQVARIIQISGDPNVAGRFYLATTGAGWIQVDIAVGTSAAAAVTQLSNRAALVAAGSKAPVTPKLSGTPSRVFHPADYGVVADGTTDDTASWAALMTALGTSPGTVYFPSGVSVCGPNVIQIATGQTFLRPRLKLKSGSTSTRLLSTRDIATHARSESNAGHHGFSIIDAQLDGNSAGVSLRPLGVIPATPSGTTTSGTLAAGTYTYRVVGYTAHGETMASLRLVHTLASTGGIAISWTAVAGAAGYRVYGRSWSQDKHYRLLADTTSLTWTDNGSVVPGTPLQGRHDGSAGVLCHIHGYDFVLGCEVRNAPGVGIMTEWMGTVPVIGNRMESTFTDIGADSCYSNGFVFAGPHDSVCTGRGIFSLNALQNPDAIDNVVAGDFGPLTFGYLHTWGQARYGLGAYTMTTVTEGELEGAKVADLFGYSDRVRFSGNIFYPDSATSKGVVIGDAEYSPPGAVIDVNIYGRSGVAFATDVDLTYSGSGYNVSLTSDKTSGTILTPPTDLSVIGYADVSTPNGVDTQTTVDAAGAFVPKDVGLLACNFDPALSVTTSTVMSASGVLQLMRVRVDRPLRVTNIVIGITTAGATLTSGQNKAALYRSDGTLVAGSTTADQSTAWTSTGIKTMAMSGGQQVLTPGYYYVAVWSNGTTRPALVRGVSAASANGVLAAASARFATSNTAVTTTAPATLGTKTLANVAYWAGLS